MTDTSGGLSAIGGVLSVGLYTRCIRIFSELVEVLLLVPYGVYALLGSADAQLFSSL